MTDATQAAATTRVGNWDRPERLRCTHLYESGARCNGTTESGTQFCHPHQRFRDADPLYPIQVPLLEDASAIRFVVSQTIRQLAMGAIPPANGRAMLYGCRMALDLLVNELAEKKFLARQDELEKKAQTPLKPTTGLNGPPSPLKPTAGLNGPPSPLKPTTGLNGPPSPLKPTAGLHGPPDNCGLEGATQTPLKPTTGLNGPPARRIVPRFPDLRQQWDDAMVRTERVLAANLMPAEGEQPQEWLADNGGPIRAGHPQTRAAAHPLMEGSIAAARSGDPGACCSPPGPDDLPFDPARPPMGRPGLTDGWREEHIAAWYRCMLPNAPEKEVRECARSLYDAWQEKAAGCATN